MTSHPKSLRIMTGDEADEEYCTVDFIKQDLVSSVYMTLACVEGIQKGREMGFLVHEKCEEHVRKELGDFPSSRALFVTPKLPFPSLLNTCHVG